MSSRVSREFRFCRFEFTISYSDPLGWCRTVRVETWCIYAFVYACAGFCWLVGMIKWNGAVYFIVSKLKNLVDPYTIYNIWFSIITPSRDVFILLPTFQYFRLLRRNDWKSKNCFLLKIYLEKRGKSSGGRNLPGSESFFINSTSRSSRRVFHN